jgi:dTMP kinase
VLIEGMDLTGKTTLARLLVDALVERGFAAVHHRGFLATRHPLRPVLDQIDPGNRPDDEALNAAFIAASMMDLLLPGVLDNQRPEVVVQESYVDRVIAYGTAAGSWPAARAAADAPQSFASFDIAVLMHAPLEVRRARLRGRVERDRVDARSLSLDFHRTFESTLRQVAARHRTVLHVDSSAQSPRQGALSVAEKLLQYAVTAAEPRRTG